MIGILIALLVLIDSWRWSHLHYYPNATGEIVTTVIDNGIWIFIATVCTIHAIKNKMCNPLKIINKPIDDETEFDL